MTKIILKFTEIWEENPLLVMKLGKDTERRDQNYDFIICIQYS